MDHQSARKLMAPAVEGSLETTQEQELALHLVGCDDCRGVYHQLEHAQRALSYLAAGHPPASAVETAVQRATTVLRGQADPGPISRVPVVPPAQPPLADDAVEEPTGVTPVSDVAPTPDVEAVGEPHDELSLIEGPETQAAPSPQTGDLPLVDEPRPPAPSADPEPPARDADTPVPPAPPEPPMERSDPDETERVEPRTVVVHPPAHGAPPLGEPPPRAQPVGEPPPQAPPSPRLPDEPIEPPASAPSPPLPRGPRQPVAPEPTAWSEAAPPSYDEDAEDRPRPGPGAWLLALAAAIILAILATYVLTRSQGVVGGGGGELPSAEEVRGRVTRLFGDMNSLKADFNIRRLGLYQVGQEDRALQYVFSDGELFGRIVYDRAEGYRQETTLEVQGDQISRTRIVRTTEEMRVLEGSGTDAQLVQTTNPAPGPPEGGFRPKLGALEDAIGTAVALMATAPDLEVVGRRTVDDAELTDVRFSVPATELTRADQIDMTLARTSFPVSVRRTISRADARVLGPEEVLSDTAIATAFGDRDRVTTELVTVDNTVIDDIILPGDLVLDEPDGVEAQTAEGAFRPVTRAEAAAELPFPPMYPDTLPDGFEEVGLAMFTGEPTGWGPQAAFPAPDGILYVTYFDGKNTIVVSIRRIPDGVFSLEVSPLATGALPVTTRSVERAEKRFTYGTSPEVPPHAYGFLGDVFAMAVGHVPENELIGVVASITESQSEPPPTLETTPTPEPSPAP